MRYVTGFLILAFTTWLVWGCGDDRRIIRPKPECLLNSDCPNPKTCLMGICTDECVEQSDCESGLMCIDNVCALASDVTTNDATLETTHSDDTLQEENETHE